MSRDFQVRPATRDWFSQWPRIEIRGLDPKEHEDLPNVPMVAIISDVNLSAIHLEGQDMLAFRSCEDELRTFWRKGGEKCVIGKATEKHKKNISAKRDFMAKLIGQVRNDKCERIVVVLEDETFFDALDAGLSMLYRYNCFREADERDAPHPLTLSVSVGGDAIGLQERAERMNSVMRSVFFVRDLVNRPPSEKAPFEIAGAISEALSGLPLESNFILHRDDENTERRADFERMGLMRAVCRGSEEEPCVLIGEYRHPEAKNKQPIVLVGKGVCFDSGGINLKSDPRGMKGDMAGAAVVFGILRAAALLELPVHLVAIAPFVYNMPSGNALKPDDVIVSYDGKTVEIGNTDAEGRLILADALAYAVEKYNPELIVDYATLTGACVTALGTDIAGVFTSAMDVEGEDWELTRMFVKAGQETDESHWPMPLYEPYFEKMRSNIANMNNIASDSWGGAITAALFLKQFVGSTPWKHIDIAGPDIFSKSKRFWPEGASGFGVRSGVRFLEKYFERN